VDFSIKRAGGSINEYIPASVISTNISSSSVKTLYTMVKLIPETDWGDDLEFRLDIEWAGYKANSQSYYGSYGGVTNTTTSDYMNYTPYANYSKNHAGYPSLPDYPSDRHQGNLGLISGNNRISEIGNDEEEDYGVDFQ